MKILIADDQSLFVEGLRHLLVTQGFEVVGTASDGLETLVKARSLHPDVILMDIQMPGHDGLTATKRIKEELPGTKVIVLTVSAEDEDLFEALKSGASGYLLKNLDAAELCDLLSRSDRGEPAIARGLWPKILDDYVRTAALAAKSDKDHEAAGEGLTLRQREVLAMVAQGYTYKEIAATLHLSPNTVKYHMMEIMERLHLTRRSEAIVYAERIGLVQSTNRSPRLRLAS